MYQGKRVAGGKALRGSARRPKKRRMTALQIIGLVGSLITIVLFLRDCFSVHEEEKTNSSGQSARIEAKGGSQAGTVQGGDGSVNVQIQNTGEMSGDSGQLEDILASSCRERRAKAYDLVLNARETKLYDEAITVIREMTKIEDTDLQSMSIFQYNLGLLLYDAGKTGAAQEAFREALKGGGFPDAFYCLGLACVKVEDEKIDPDYQEAIEAFTRAIEAAEKPEYYRARAWAYEKGGLLELAEQDWETAESLTAVSA